MYICKESGLMQYETLDEILSAELLEATEYAGNYYFIVKYEDMYHNTVWVVNKETEAVSQISLIDYLMISAIKDKAKPINPATLKRVG